MGGGVAALGVSFTRFSWLALCLHHREGLGLSRGQSTSHPDPNATRARLVKQRILNLDGSRDTGYRA
jgi:hypothetical protein